MKHAHLRCEAARTGRITLGSLALLCAVVICLITGQSLSHVSSGGDNAANASGSQPPDAAAASPVPRVQHESIADLFQIERDPILDGDSQRMGRVLLRDAESGLILRELSGARPWDGFGVAAVLVDDADGAIVAVSAMWDRGAGRVYLYDLVETLATIPHAAEPHLQIAGRHGEIFGVGLFHPSPEDLVALAEAAIEPRNPDALAELPLLGVHSVFSVGHGDGYVRRSVHDARTGQALLVESDESALARGAILLGADLNRDGVVDADDLAVLLGQWGRVCPADAADCRLLGDLNGDGVVNAQDLAILLANWGREAAGLPELDGHGGWTQRGAPCCVTLDCCLPSNTCGCAFCPEWCGGGGDEPCDPNSLTPCNNPPCLGDDCGGGGPGQPCPEPPCQPKCDDCPEDCEVDIEGLPDPPVLSLPNVDKGTPTPVIELTAAADATGSFEWSVDGGDGAWIIGSHQMMNVTIMYAEAGEYKVTVTYTSPEGETCTNEQVFHVVDEPHMRVFRPQTWPFQFITTTPPRYLIPYGDQQSPGAGIRPNANENVGGNLIAVRLMDVQLTLPDGVEYALVRSSDSLKVWRDQARTVSILVEDDSAAVIITQSPELVWVEWADPALAAAPAATLELQLRTEDEEDALCSDSATFYPFQSIVVVLGGNTQNPADPPDVNHGIFHLGKDLYLDGYDVHMFAQTAVNPGTGLGAAFDAVTDAVAQRGASEVSIIGFSYGGGAVYNLSSALAATPPDGGFNLVFSAYIDGIRQGSVPASGENRRPLASGMHTHYYQQNTGILGAYINGAPLLAPLPQDFQLNVNTTPWGADLVHTTIDDHPNVLNGVETRLTAATSR